MASALLVSAPSRRGVATRKDARWGAHLWASHAERIAKVTEFKTP
jgi:hypothetical protein